jgi:hypothetical protein
LIKGGQITNQNPNRIDNATLNLNVMKGGLDNQYLKMKQGIKLTDLSKSANNENDTRSDRSNSRKNR